MSQPEYNQFPLLRFEIESFRERVIHAMQMREDEFKASMDQAITTSFAEFDFQKAVNSIFQSCVEDSVRAGIKDYFESGRGQRIMDQAIDEAVRSTLKKSSEQL